MDSGAPGFVTWILIVDDDPDICIALTDLLEHEGYHVVSVGTGTEAIAKAESRAFGAVILDLGLPDLDGFSVLRALANVDPRLSVIILTALGSEQKRLAGLQQAFAYLTKPYDREELKATVARAVGLER
jgi:DNA-binding response OmpR family regulator